MSEAFDLTGHGTTQASVAAAWSTPLAEVDPSQIHWFEDNSVLALFERLRREAPVLYHEDSSEGPYWSVTRYADIKAVDMDHKVFSSDSGITLFNVQPEFDTRNFIAMDPPQHDEQRQVVSPVVAPPNLKRLEGTIRERVHRILDDLPVGETFNWVERVSIELTTQMLATLFDFPFEDRRKLTYWSDTATNRRSSDPNSPEEQQRRGVLLECLDYFTRLFEERKNKPPSNDLVSMLAHGESTRDLPPLHFLGNLILLIVGGNDTTRNSISGGVLALNQYPAEYAKLRGNPALIPNMVSEIIRWQTPLAYMRRTALEDTQIRGQKIRRGDKVAMWYLSGNRDEAAFMDDPDAFLIDRKDARKHLSFGFGIHRCMGNRVAEMQLRILWEEILRRFRMVEVVGEPVRTRSAFVRGYTELPVVVHPL